MLIKRASEKRLYDVDLKLHPEFDDGTDEIVEFTSQESEPEGLVFTGPTFEGSIAQCWISGGTAELTYVVKFKVKTNTGAELEDGFDLLIKEVS